MEVKKKIKIKNRMPRRFEKFFQALRQSIFFFSLSNSTLQETNSHIYLGVELSQDLRWTNHINKTTVKANKVLGFIRHNLHS